MKKRIDYNSPVILTFVIVALGALILGMITRGFVTEKFFMVYRSSLFNPLTYLRLFTHVLGHADISHYMGNIMIILLVGPMLEEKYGSQDLLIMMLITAVATGLIFLVFFPNGSLCGASGIAFMMIVLSSATCMRDGKIPLTLILVVALYLGQQIVDGLMIRDNVSQLAHIVGGVLGGAFGFVYRKKQ